MKTGYKKTTYYDNSDFEFTVTYDIDLELLEYTGLYLEHKTTLIKFVYYIR